MEQQKAWLLLADGSLFEGYSFGAAGTVVGEIVFTTGMVGYQETLTDPSYYGQIVTQTFPLIGNYGINSFDYESARCYLSGYIVREWCEEPSNFRCEETIDAFLKSQNVIGLYGIDTRRLTRIIRESGVMNGVITNEKPNPEEWLPKIQAFTIHHAVDSVTCKKSRVTPAENEEFRVTLMDYGYKFNIERELVKRGCTVTVLPANATVDEILATNPDGIMLSNGPGNPAENVEIIETLRELLPHKIPTFGICLGHQLMALANGGSTKKLKYGHRGSNQPVIDLELDRTFVTSQNHGYAVVNESISPEVGQVSHVNANDGTCEGVRYHNAPVFTVQFHPEACGGPHDTAYLFDEFLDLIRKGSAC